MSYSIHSSSYIGENVEIGAGTRIWYFCHISDNATIGKNCNVGQNVFVDNGVSIGNNVKIQNNVSVYKGVNIADDVFLGPSCVFTNVINPRSFIERKHEIKKTLVDKGATVGANATIICGVHLGAYSMIGAGATVTKDVLPYSLMKGSPARHYGYVCMCGVKLNKHTSTELSCPSCNEQYDLEDDILIRREKNGN
jgi:UDP-2-acetamido-3-amino-2,3-dideoxy-glucuronate N-acetyltransferase